MKNRSTFSIPIVLASLVVLSMLGSCQTSTTSTPVHQEAGVSLPSGRTPTDDEAVASDPCSIRLHDIEGTMLLYYAVNKRLPVTLDELKPFVDAGSELELVCPVSHQPYQYYQSGLMSPGRSKRIIVCDPTPAHHGNRWCILMPYVAPGSAMSLEVVTVPEADFKTYLPGIQ